MIASIGTGQFIGACIDSGFWMCAGGYIVWLWPRRVRRDIESGKITAEEGAAKLKKFNPRLGYLVILWGLVRMGESISRYV